MELSRLDSRRHAAGQLQAGGGDGSDSSWDGFGFGSKKGLNDGQTERLLGGPSSSSSSFSSSVSTDGAGEGARGVDPCVVCCTIFSLCGAFLLILLGIYAAADSEGKYLVLRTREQENPFVEELRGTKAGHIFGAALLYLLFVGGCGYKWYKREPLWKKKQ